MLAVLFHPTDVCYCNIKLQDFIGEPVQIMQFGDNSAGFGVTYVSVR